MTILRFIHAADLHLGRPFSGLTRSSPLLAELFLGAGYKSWDRIVETAIREGVSFVTLGGDVFDSGVPSLRPRAAFRAGVQKLQDAGIPAFLALGNHDPLSDFPGALRSLSGLHLFGPQPEGKVFHPTHGGPTVTVHGVSYEKPVVKENLVRLFRRQPGTDIAIGLVHANVSGVSGHDDYAPCTIKDLRSAGMDVWCMGHVHLGTVLQEDPLILYAGTSQGAHINESGPRGCYLVTIRGQRDAFADFIPLAPVRWERVEIDVTGLSQEDELLDTAEGVCATLVSDEDTLDAVVVRMDLKGRTALRLHGSDQDFTELLETLTDRLASLPVPVFPESIRNLSRSTIDVDSLIKEEGFLADFLKLCRTSASDPNLVEELLNPLETELSKNGYGRYIDQTGDLRQLKDDPRAMGEILEQVQEMVVEMFAERSGQSG